MKSLEPIFLAGPTAVGKSAVALRLAEILRGEIISVDSMQVYKGLDVGTAKPSLLDRERIPHHLIDVVDLTESFDAAQFAKLALKAVEEILARERLPIFCGGTGLYFKALIDGLGEAPPASPQMRDQLAAIPLEELLHELQASDPETFEGIDKNNPRRVIRALEVIRLTGKPFSRQQSAWNDPKGKQTLNLHGRETRIRCFGLERAREDLHRRIDERVEEMFRLGLLAETAALLNLGLASNKTAMQAIGYRQVVEHLKGERTLSETIALVKQRTRQFAKRQMTWFKRQAALQWVSLGTEENIEASAARLIEKLQAAR